jgi:MSHA pilin protein MshD
MPVNKTLGFTLVELVTGIVVLAIALSLFLAFLVPLSVRSVDPIFQVRAAELGQAYMNEIMSKSFDEESSRDGTGLRCNEVGESPCRTIDPNSTVGNRLVFDDIDDYNNINVTGGQLLNSSNQAILRSDGRNLYEGFSVSVTTFYDDDFDGVNDGASVIGNVKLVTLTVTTPNAEQISFSAYKTNY